MCKSEVVELRTSRCVSASDGSKHHQIIKHSSDHRWQVNISKICPNDNQTRLNPVILILAGNAGPRTRDQQSGIFERAKQSNAKSKTRSKLPIVSKRLLMQISRPGRLLVSEYGTVMPDRRHASTPIETPV